LGTVSYSHSVATMAVSLAVSTQYTNVTDSQPDIARRRRPRLCIASRGNNSETDGGYAWHQRFRDIYKLHTTLSATNVKIRFTSDCVRIFTIVSAHYREMLAIARTMPLQDVRLSVRLSHAGIPSK